MTEYGFFKEALRVNNLLIFFSYTARRVKHDVQTTVNKSIDFLKKSHLEDGSFLSLSSADSGDFQGAKIYHSTFLTSLILLALPALSTSSILSVNKAEGSEVEGLAVKDISQNPEFHTICEKGVDFLLRQKSKYWSFNYWARNAKENEVLPYPDDLDDTSCALSAIFSYHPEVIDASAMAKIVTLLTTLEVEEGGPYRTWLVGEEADKIWRDVDLAVNSNVAYFLHLQEIELPRLTAFIETRIKSGDITSPYYPSVFPIIYFISRFYRGPLVSKLQNILLTKRKKDHSFGNPLETALAVTALLTLGYESEKLEKSIQALLKTRVNNHWPAYGICFDPTIKDVKYYAGSPALTTALCIEALNKYLHASKPSVTPSQKNKTDTDLYHKVSNKVEEYFKQFTPDVATSALTLLEKFKKVDVQIALMPYYFAASLKKKVNKDLLFTLAQANLFGWTAYTIFDDFLDEEGNPRTIPAATIAYRRLVAVYTDLFADNPDFLKLFHSIMDQMDAANAWEVANCRIKIMNDKVHPKGIQLPDWGNYRKLAERSLGHAMTPLAILSRLGYSTQSKETKNILDFFTHYLIAKQLNDDAHDWENDLKMGHLTPVVTILLKRYLRKNAKKTYTLQRLSKSLQKLLWNEVIVEICRDIKTHIKKARRLLTGSVIKDPTYLEKLLVPLEAAADKALIERRDTLLFLKNYKPAHYGF